MASRPVSVWSRYWRRPYQPSERRRPVIYGELVGGGNVPPHVVPPAGVEPGGEPGGLPTVPPSTPPGTGPGDPGVPSEEGTVGAFCDDFDRTDRDLDGDNGWLVMGQSGVGGGIVEIQDRAAQNAAQVESTAYQWNTIPGTNAQEVSAWITSTTEGNDQHIDLIINGAWASTYVGRSAGVLLRFAWLPSHERVIEIWQETPSTLPAATTITFVLLGSLQLVSQGGPVNSGYHGRLIDEGAVNALQHVRLIVREGDFGLIAAAYVNQEDDDHPTLEVNLRIDMVPATAVAGNWGFGFGSATANTLVITQFCGTDYELAAAKATVMLPSQPTVLELRELVKRHFSGGAGTDLDDFFVDALVIEQLEQIVHELGEAAWFLERQEELTISVDSLGYATMPSYVERVFDVERRGDLTPSKWNYAHHSSAGDVVIRMRSGSETTDSTYLVTFRQRWERSDRPNDVTVIPRQHMFVVVWGVCLTLASTRDRKPALADSFGGLYQSRLASLKAEARRHWNQKKVRLQPRRRAASRPFQIPGPRY